ncbi:PREDICTED: uncharacterized protein LOC109182629 [Ipomoea nil]|uniref:uncharacterized protein LOC109182629 n=1 Tax=Ipomoea nil TaxID=35883 RepID=UPI0009018C29|nr:PREDICTED: uncharacterized protein LOC109182629 [Ipomoea nil]
MAKGWKLTKFKSAVLKKMQSFKLSRGTGGGSSVVVATTNSFSDDEHCSGPYSAAASSKDLHPVYVGKSRRRYLVGSDIIDHPLFRELAERSGSYSDESIAVRCEVVLFEHLLWMLENADPQPESLDELVECNSANQINVGCEVGMENGEEMTAMVGTVLVENGGMKVHGGSGDTTMCGDDDGASAACTPAELERLHFLEDG